MLHFARYTSVSALFFVRQQLLFEQDFAVTRNDYDRMAKIDALLRECDARIVTIELTLSTRSAGKQRVLEGLAVSSTKRL